MWRALAFLRWGPRAHRARVGIEIYFADPHSPWQRPTNENTNGLLRQYFPKGINFDLVDARIREVADELNDRPRLCLDDRSAGQLMARWPATRQHLIRDDG